MALLAGIALAVTTLEIRGVTFAGLFGVPGAAALAVYTLRRIEAANRSKAVQACLAIAVLFFASEVSFDVVGKFVQQFSAHAHLTDLRQKAALCYQQPTLSALNTLPPAKIAAFVDQGPVIMAYTHHAVISGPYHRDAVGILDTNTVFAGSQAEARRIIDRRGIDYVEFCSLSADYGLYLKENNKGLLADLTQGRVPSWLKPVPAGDPMHVLSLYRVVR
jgi:hypothetical protein